MAAAKPRIDLKARLGRKSAAPSAAPPSAPAASVPPATSVPPAAAAPGASPPVASVVPAATAPVGSAPAAGVPVLGASRPVTSAPPAAAAAAAPAPGRVVSSQAPPFAAAAPAGGMGVAPRAVARPGVAGPGGMSIPPPPGYGKKEAPQPQVAARAAPAAAPLSIKMEVGEEVHQAQAAARKKALVFALVAAVIGILVGFGVGSGVKGKEGADAAVQGAKALIGEVQASNDKVSELNDTLKAAAQKVKSNEFPSAEIEALGAMEIPFDGTNLLNKGIGRYNAIAVTMLLQYANSVQGVKDQRDKLRRLFGAAKPAFEAQAKEKTTPQVHWGAALGGGPQGPWVTMVRLTPVPVKPGKDAATRWGRELTLANGKDKMERYVKGDPTKGGDPSVIPVNPASEEAVCSTNVRAKLLGALLDLGKQIQGDQTPGREVQGVLDLGEKVSERLRPIANAG